MFGAWGESLGFVYNDAFIPVPGERHPAALGRPEKEIWPDVREAVNPLLERALSGESVYFEDHPLVMMRDGQPNQMWFTFSYSPAYDDDGHVCGMSCIATDTTRNVLARQHLKIKEQQLNCLAKDLEKQVEKRTRERDQIWRNSPDLLLIIDRMGMLRSVDPAWKAVLGYESDDLVGKSFQPFVHPDDMTAELLRELQFNVIGVESGLDAPRVLQLQTISLLVSDVGLPGGMDGRQLAQAARILHPELNVLLITGYAENAAVRNGLLEKGMEVMTKPFNMQAFAAKVQNRVSR
jgi:PAS domain-containing protein